MVTNKTRQSRRSRCTGEKTAERSQKERNDSVERREQEKDAPPPHPTSHLCYRGKGALRVTPMRIVADRQEEYQRTGVFDRTPYRTEKSAGDDANNTFGDSNVLELPNAPSIAGGMRAPPIPNKKSGAIVRRRSEPSRTRFKDIGGGPNRLAHDTSKTEKASLSFKGKPKSGVSGVAGEGGAER